MFVWNAMPSMASMMLDIWPALCVIVSMVDTALVIISPLRRTSVDTEAASALARRAVSALVATVAVSCSVAEAVSSTPAA
jgi:dihydrodipicolinate synthase/N-acetylneuraminate lyase